MCFLYNRNVDIENYTNGNMFLHCVKPILKYVQAEKFWKLEEGGKHCFSERGKKLLKEERGIFFENICFCSS